VAEYVNVLIHHIGLLHRGTEKLAEYRTFLQTLPLFWSTMTMFQQCHKNICYVLAFGTVIKYIVYRCVHNIFDVIFLELYAYTKSYLSCNDACIGCWCVDAVFMGFWRKRIYYEFYERVSEHAYIVHNFKPGGVAYDIKKRSVKWY